MAKKTKESNALAVIDNIEDRIYVIRGQRVMLDADLADVYQVETRVLNQALKRNLQRFPPDFVFQLTGDEAGVIRSQAVSASKPFMRSQSVSASKRNIRYLPYAFTEHGAVMLASVLNSPTAVEASIAVVRAFVKMRTILALHKDLSRKVDQLAKVAAEHDGNFEVVFQLLADIMHDPKKLRRNIGFVETKKRKKK
jgi:hypothetical protein